MIIKRYPETSNKSLKSWSAIDEYLLKFASKCELKQKSISIYHDRFGYLSLNLIEYAPNVITHYYSQKNSIQQNLESNNLNINDLNFESPISDSDNTIDIAIVKIPKSMELFRLTLHQVSKNANKDMIVYCGFMTRHFTKQMIAIASEYFEEVNQSLAWKKSRILSLSKPKQRPPSNKTQLVNMVEYTDHTDKSHNFRQYFGVFSGRHIDYATQFLLNHLEVNLKVKKALDLACGNGVIGHYIRNHNPDCELHLLDDSLLAIESAKLNMGEVNNIYHWADSAKHIEGNTFDLIVCNPPFHFEHENTIDIALGLFNDAKRILTQDGEFCIVSNLHLNYKTHLNKIFNSVEVVNMNSKFEIIKCANQNWFN